MNTAIVTDNEKAVASTKGYRNGVVALLTSALFVMAVDRGSIAVAVPLIIKEFHLNPASMGFALSAFFCSYVVFNIPISSLADKVGSKTVLGWSAAFWSLATVATGLVVSLPTLVLARMGVGLGEAATAPTASKIVTDNFPSKERGFAIGAYIAGTRLGMAAVPIIMAFLMSRWGWRAAFFLTGIGSLMWCAVWYFSFHDKSRCLNTARLKTTIPWKLLLTNRATLGLILTKFFQDYLLYLFMTWVPAYLVMERGFSILKMGVFASIPWIIGSIAPPLAGAISDGLMNRGISTTVARKSVMIGSQVMAATVMGVGFISDPMIAVYCLTFSILGESAAGSVIWVLLSESAPPKYAGSIGGIMNTAGALAGVLSPTITGILVKVTGNFQMALAIGGLMLLIAAMSVGFIIPQLKPMSVEVD